jgi:lipopolysaccharide/colanic/teichoic acid biosynthesis glycosyltransferase
MWKFRTMIQDAEELESIFMEENKENGPFFKVRNDPRLIKYGSFLRKYSIDELPQLINVLKGDMSLVGPRPLFDHEVDKFSESKQYLRFIMKPGLTCTWQVNGRSNTPFEVRMKYDLEYIENWSLSLDIILLLKTLPAVLKGEGAV